jgi:hypothetical protein
MFRFSTSFCPPHGPQISPAARATPRNRTIFFCVLTLRLLPCPKSNGNRSSDLRAQSVQHQLCRSMPEVLALQTLPTDALGEKVGTKAPTPKVGQTLPTPGSEVGGIVPQTLVPETQPTEDSAAATAGETQIEHINSEDTTTAGVPPETTAEAMEQHLFLHDERSEEIRQNANKLARNYDVSYGEAHGAFADSGFDASKAGDVLFTCRCACTVSRHVDKTEPMPDLWPPISPAEVVPAAATPADALNEAISYGSGVPVLSLLASAVAIAVKLRPRFETKTYFMAAAMLSVGCCSCMFIHWYMQVPSPQRMQQSSSLTAQTRPLDTSVHPRRKR